MDHHFYLSFDVKNTKMELDNNDNYQYQQMLSVDIKVEKEAEETNDDEDWCVENFTAGNLLKPVFFKQDTDIQCSICFKYFLDQYDVYRHNLSHLQVTIVNPTFIQCDICGSFFDNIKSIERHMPIHNTSITNTLSYKPKAYNYKEKEKNKIRTFNSQHNLLKDYKNKSNLSTNSSAQKSKFPLTGNDKNPTEKPYQCNICSKSYTYSNWHGHMQEVHGTGKYSCDFCDMVFKCKRYLNRHLLKHFGMSHKWKGSVKMDVKCDQCDTVLQSSYALTTHKRNVHSGEKFTCHICKSTLKCKSYLKAHMLRVHCTWERHECDCGKVFRSDRYLMVHKRNAHSKKKDNILKTGNNSRKVKNVVKDS